jgi:two-component system chemotaxis response regulator CheB
VYELAVIGASWGGLRAVGELLAGLPERLELAFAVAQHRGPDSRPGGLEELLQAHTGYRVLEAGDKDPIEPGCVYVAPPDYHLLIERGSFALSLDPRVNYARPSIDVMFESASDAYRERLIGIVLTGANEDGAAGLALIKRRGGVAIVQDPREAEAPAMPAAALAALAATSAADAVLPLAEIGRFLHGLCLEPEAQPPVRESGPVEGVWGNREVPPAGDTTRSAVS